MQGLGFEVPGAGCRVQDSVFWGQDLRFKVENLRCRVQGSGLRVNGLERSGSQVYVMGIEGCGARGATL